MKISQLKHPKMVPSSVLKPRLRSVMAEGGEVQDVSMKAPEPTKEAPAADLKEEATQAPSEPEVMAEQPDEEEIEHASSIAAAIMAKRRKMADGGAVDIEENNEEESNTYDSLNAAALKENYDHMDDMEEPMDSNEHAPEHEEDINDADIVTAIRRKMKLRSAMTK